MKKFKLRVFVSYLLLLLAVVLGLLLLFVLVTGYGNNIEGTWEDLSGYLGNEKERLLSDIVAD